MPIASDGGALKYSGAGSWATTLLANAGAATQKDTYAIVILVALG